jgi:polar amino acid transport system substrate-binding protein
MTTSTAATISRILACAMVSLGVLASAASAGTDDKLRAMLPAKVRDSGALNIAISLAYPPMEYSDAGSTDLKGADIDMAKEVADRLGLKPNFQNVEFPQLITSVTTGRADMIWTAFSDLPERQTQLDFIDYFQTGNQLYSMVKNQETIKSVKDLCGKAVAVATGTSWVGLVERVGKETCTQGSPLTVLQLPTEAEHILQMKQDRAQASIMGFEGILELQKQKPGEFYTIGDLLEPGHYGIAFAKDSGDLQKAVKATLEAMKVDGTYVAILDRYGLKNAAVSEFTVNAGR